MKALQLMALVVVVLLLTATPLMAAEPNTSVFSGAAIGAGIGAGVTIIGAGYGFGRIGSAALEGMARQPEVAANVQTAMIVIAALLEGATFFALIICIILQGKATF
jgi:F-type H+-transporting ATPase subunit c